MKTPKNLPKGFRLPKNAPLDLKVEDDDFLDHPDEFDEADLIDEESQEFFALFPEGGDEALAEEWRKVFEGDASLREAAPRTAAVYGAVAGAGYSGSGRDLGIAARLRAYGLKVVEVSGWQTRGSSEFHPRGSIDHHTAGGLSGNAPSLGICTNGRSDLPGPLCQVLIGRDNTCYVIASGRANHAGTGSYGGVTGNSNVYGVERENTGVGNEPWREDQRLTAAKVHAALLDWRRGSFVCQHKEWAPTRKIDVWDQSGPDMRTRVANSWVTFDNPTPPPEEVIMFKAGTNIENIVKDCYRKIVGREPESQAVVDTWHWSLAVSQGEGYAGLVNGLHYEQRVRAENALAAERKRINDALVRIGALENAEPINTLTEAEILAKVYADLTSRIQ